MAASDGQALLLTVSADTSKALKALDQLNQKLSGVAPQMERTAKKAMEGLEKGFTGEGFGKALDKVFDSSRLAVLEEGSTKLRLFGSALEPLGPLGIGAAAAIAAVGIAGERAREAMEWADDLDRSSKALGVTITGLQQLDYASVATSIGLKEGREALADFNTMIGKFETHNGDAKMVSWAKSIQLTRDQVNQTVDPIEKLQLVLEKIAALPDAQSRAGAAKAFGLEQLLPLINEGSEGIDKFIGKMKEAQSVGVLVDPRQIAQAAELNDKVEELTYRIGVDFKRAFIELAPAVETVAVFIERCTHALSDFLGELPDAIRGIEELINKIPHAPTVNLSDNLKSAVGQAAKDATLNLIPGGRQLADLGGAAAGAFNAAVQEGRSAKLRDKVNALLAGKPVNLIGSDYDPALGRQGQGRQLHFDAPKHGPADQTAEFDKASTDAYQAGLKALITAQAALTSDIQTRADAEKAAIDADLTKKVADLNAEEAKIMASKNDAHKAEQLALIEKAKTEEQNAAAAKKELVDRNAAFAIEDQSIELYKSKVSAQLAELQAQASIAGTAKERAELELRILALRQQLERDLQETAIDRRVKTNELTPEQGAKLKTDYEATQDAQAAAQKVQIALSTHPIEAYLAKLQDVASAMENEGVTALDGLASGVADLVANGGKAIDVLRNLVRTLLYDFTKMNVQQLEGSVLGRFGIKAPTGNSAATISSAISSSGATAAQAMGAAITTAGAEAAAQLAAAMAGGSLGSSGGVNFLGGLFGGGGFSGAFGAGDIGGGFDFGVGGLALDGFAGGTDGAPGGWARINELGPEGLAFLPPGTKVIPNDVLRGLSKVGQAGAGDTYAPTLNLHVYPQPGTSAADARRTGSQVGAAAMGRMAQARRKGFGNG